MNKKNCLQCGKEFEKPPTCSLAEWHGNKRRPNGVRFCSVSCFDTSRRGKENPKMSHFHSQSFIESVSGKNSPLWKHGKTNKAICSRQKARRIVVRVIGRKLSSKETVHHIDENPFNNSVNNLFLFRNSEAHTRWHHFLRRSNLKGLLVSNIKK